MCELYSDQQTTRRLQRRQMTLLVPLVKSSGPNAVLLAVWVSRAVATTDIQMQSNAICHLKKTPVCLHDSLAGQSGVRCPKLHSFWNLLRILKYEINITYKSTSTDTLPFARNEGSQRAACTPSFCNHCREFYKAC